MAYGKRLLYLSLSFIALCGISTSAHADQLLFNNGDKLSGTIVSSDDTAIVLENENFGTLTIQRNTIEQIISPVDLPEQGETVAEEDDTSAPNWTREIESGYAITSGNTETSSFNFSANVNRKTEENETTFKANIFQSSSQEKMDNQRWDTMGRHAFSFGEAKDWFNFYKIAVDHDKFATIDYRISPSAGIGYWFSDEDPFQAMAELGLGYEYTNYNNDDASSDEVVVIPRIYIEWLVYNEARLSEELTLYPSISDMGHYRLTSHTTFSNPISKNLSLKLRLTDEYNSDPAANTENNDIRFTSALSYSF